MEELLTFTFFFLHRNLANLQMCYVMFTSDCLDLLSQEELRCNAAEGHGFCIPCVSWMEAKAHNN